MKALLRITLALLVTLAWVGCDNNEEDPGTGDDPSAIYGTWLSAGDNLGTAFAELGFTSIEATFNADGTYVVDSDFAGTPIQQTGTYETSATSAGEIRTITLEQETPNRLTAQGIYEVDGDVLIYEAIDVSQGTPPTAAGGFGSSVVPDDEGSDYTQTYVRVED